MQIARANNGVEDYNENDYSYAHLGNSDSFCSERKQRGRETGNEKNSDKNDDETGDRNDDASSKIKETPFECNRLVSGAPSPGKNDLAKSDNEKNCAENNKNSGFDNNDPENNDNINKNNVSDDNIDI
ncbi:hypothetical protein MHBO_002423 [Bonamia ostreae]|uniref:Uncharacterized protein n=1 Tax=Bonamia ostreae TaxID=126728 RepID=A0ABV2AMC0_9EUKA